MISEQHQKPVDGRMQLQDMEALFNDSIVKTIELPEVDLLGALIKRARQWLKNAEACLVQIDHAATRSMNAVRAFRQERVREFMDEINEHRQRAIVEAAKEEEEDQGSEQSDESEDDSGHSAEGKEATHNGRSQELSSKTRGQSIRVSESMDLWAGIGRMSMLPRPSFDPSLYAAVLAAERSPGKPLKVEWEGGHKSAPVTMRTLYRLIEEARRLPVRFNQVAELEQAIASIRGLSERITQYFPTITPCPSNKPPRECVLGIGESETAEEAAQGKAEEAAPSKAADNSGDKQQLAFAAGKAFRSGVPLPILEAMILETWGCGVAFAEGESLKGVAQEVQQWLARAHEAVGYHRKAKLSEISSLAAEAAKLPVDLSEQILTLKSELARANDWVTRVRAIFPRYSRAMRGAETAVSGAAARCLLLRRGNAAPRVSLQDASITAVQSLLREAHSGGLPMGVREVEEVETILENAEDWRARVHEALTAAREGGTSAERGSGSIVDMLQTLLRQSEGVRIELVSVFLCYHFFLYFTAAGFVQEEKDILEAEVWAFEWTAKCRKALEAKTKRENLKELLSELDDKRVCGYSFSCGHPL